MDVDSLMALTVLYLQNIVLIYYTNVLKFSLIIEKLFVISLEVYILSLVIFEISSLYYAV